MSQDAFVASDGTNSVDHVRALSMPSNIPHQVAFHVANTVHSRSTFDSSRVLMDRMPLTFHAKERANYLPFGTVYRSNDFTDVVLFNRPCLCHSVLYGTIILYYANC